jgi:hypothetical protein
MQAPTPLRRRPGVLASAAAGLVLAAGCAAADDWVLPHSLDEAVRMERQNALPLTAFYDAPALAGTQPGALLRQEPFTGYATPTGARAVRILYHSLDAAGHDVATSGVVLIPAGAAPAGGWPVIAWAHGTTGVARMCAPSLQKDMAYGEEGLMPMVRAGFAVVATDYHGLGTQGPHQYLAKLAQARDVVYSLPAARAAVPELGRPWVVIGHSQGAAASWGAAELEATLKDPDFRGAIAVSGAADLTPQMAAMGRPGSSAAYYLVYMAYAIHARNPAFQPSEMLDGVALSRYDDATTQGCWNYVYASFLGKNDAPVVKPGWNHLAAVEEFARAREFGREPVGGPLLVLTGEADQTVLFPLVKVTVKRACEHGIALAFRSYPGLDHDPTMDKSTPDQLAWVRERLAGKPFANGCAQLAL